MTVNARGDKPNRHDILTGSDPQGYYSTAGGDTTYLCAAGTDPSGRLMGVSLIQSIGRIWLEVSAIAGDVLERIDVIRSGQVVRTFAGTGSPELSVTEPIADLESGEYLYVRVVQADGGAAWSSPFFVD